MSKWNPVWVQAEIDVTTKRLKTLEDERYKLDAELQDPDISMSHRFEIAGAQYENMLQRIQTSMQLLKLYQDMPHD